MATFAVIEMRKESSEDASSVPTTDEQTQAEVFEGTVVNSPEPLVLDDGEEQVMIEGLEHDLEIGERARIAETLLEADVEIDEDARDDFLSLAEQMHAWGLEYDVVAASLRDAADRLQEESR